MPIYEYEPIDPRKGCKECKRKLEMLQAADEKPLSNCPFCGQEIRKVISLFRVKVTNDNFQKEIETQIKKYEKDGMWSHAAELAEKHSNNLKDNEMKIRALENYKKAGYDLSFIEDQNK